MKRVSLVAVTLLFAAFLAVSAHAQTPATGDKIGLIAWGAFEDPAKGIKKYVAALTSLETEFKPLNDELKTLAAKYDALGKEIQGLRELKESGKPVPVPDSEIQKKIDTLGQLERDIKKKQEDAKATYQSRFNIVVGPIQDDIIKALSDYATAKGYAVILDGARLQETQILLGFNQKANVTEDFIVYYNSRPTTAAVTKP